MSTAVSRGFCGTSRVFHGQSALGVVWNHRIMKLWAFRLEKISWIVESNHANPPLCDVPAWHLHICQIPPEFVGGITFWSVPLPQSCRAAPSAVSSTRVPKRSSLYIRKATSLLQDPARIFPIPTEPGCRTDFKVIFGKLSASRCEPLAFFEDFFSATCLFNQFFCFFCP